MIKINCPTNYGSFKLINKELGLKSDATFYRISNAKHFGQASAIRLLKCKDAKHGNYLHGFLNSIGANFKLSVGELEGLVKVAPKFRDIWTYSDGEPLEEAWFYEWHLTPKSIQILTEQSPNYIKTSFLLYLANAGYKLSTVPISVVRMPELFKNSKEWVFEFEV